MATEVIYTIDRTGAGDYTTLNAALAGVQSNYPNLVSSDVVIYLRYIGDWTGGNDTTTPSFPSLTTNYDTNYVQIETDSANRHAGVLDFDKAAIVLASSYVTVSTTDVRLVGLQISSNSFFGVWGFSGGALTIDQCVIYQASSSGNNIICGSGSIFMKGTVAYGGRYAVTYDTGTDGYIESSSAYSDRRAVTAVASSVVIAKNVIAITENPGSFNAWDGTFDSESDYNAGNDSTAPGANSIDSISTTGTFLDRLNGDLHISPSDTQGLIGGGIDLSNDPSFPVTTDINGNPFLNPPSIGAHEAGVAPTTTDYKAIFMAFNF